MTTKFFDNKICETKFYCRGVSHEKQRFGRFSSLPPSHPPQNRKFCFYCRLAPSFPSKISKNSLKEFAQTVCANCFYLAGWLFGWVAFP